ncbi:DUF5908 family protein [Methylobacter sp. sgz302048]|uniref:DUF5908 family protein n=1 Tax=Methylobacter sp. sgz302048 TaxID=3455945 RepID=UPI003FA04E6B
MPIEIKELHINVTIDATPQTPNAVGPAGGGAAVGNNEIDKDAIIAECVDQVLQILQNKKER